MRESKVEAAHCAADKAAGGMPYKFTSPARANVPDRLRLFPIPVEHRELVAKYVRFAEFKAPGKKPTAAQEREHQRLRDMGFVVDVISELPQ